MFTRLCSVVSEIMPDARRNEWCHEMTEFRRSDGQYVLIGTTLDGERWPVVIMSVLERTAGGLGVTQRSSWMRVGGLEVPVRVTYSKYLDRPARLLITYRLAADDRHVKQAESVLRWVVCAMEPADVRCMGRI